MPVRLSDIRYALESYARTRLTLDMRVSEPSPHAPASVQRVIVSCRVSNVVPARGGMRVTDLVWQVWVEGPGVLVVPAVPAVATDAHHEGAPALPAGSHVRAMQIRFPVGHECHALVAGESAVHQVEATSEPGPDAGQMTVCFSLLATVDLDWLLPRSAASAVARKAVRAG